jgi:hypothetical protein
MRYTKFKMVLFTGGTANEISALKDPVGATSSAGVIV